jgi:hypothetical protein
MCYPKPGPRCSTSAAATYAQARHNLLKHLRNREDEDNYVEYEKLRKRLEHAEKEYSITPAGLKQLERSYNGGKGGDFAANKLEAARNLRELRLAKLRKEQRVEKEHKRTKKVPVYYNSSLSSGEETLKRVTQQDPRLDHMLAESHNWLQHLTPDEIDTVRDYTQGGYDTMNALLNTPNWEEDQYPETVALRENVKLMDSALAKHKVDRKVTLYRRHGFYGDNHLRSGRGSSTHIAETFIPGSTYKSSFFMSTTLNPADMPEKNETIAVLEILSKKAVPVSAAANSSTFEQEFIIPRNTEFRVVSVNKKLVAEGHDGEPKTIHVIQLEEI